MVAYIFTNLGPWTWGILGLLLIGIELFAPGAFMIWLGIAAIATGITVWLFGLGWQAGMLVYALLALVAVVFGRWLNLRIRQADDEVALNRSDRDLVGRVFRLDAPLMEGEGRLRVADSSWRITGPDIEQGAHVRVVRIDGATLVVEPV